MFFEFMNLAFITIDGARQDRIINGENFKNYLKNQMKAIMMKVN